MAIGSQRVRGRENEGTARKEEKKLLERAVAQCRAEITDSILYRKSHLSESYTLQSLARK